MQYTLTPVSNFFPRIGVTLIILLICTQILCDNSEIRQDEIKQKHPLKYSLPEINTQSTIVKDPEYETEYSGLSAMEIILITDDREYADDIEEVIGVPDSLEPVNRPLFVINDFILLWIIRPLTFSYSFIIPKDGRKAIRRVSDNIEFPIRFFSSLFQAEFKKSGITAERFFINTTLGIAGIFDVADWWFDLKPQEEDFGQTFAVWGISPGSYLVIPVYGPSTVRGGIGLIFDFAFDPKTYLPIPGIQAFCSFNNLSLRIDQYQRLIDSEEDPYVTVKDIWYLFRMVKISE